MLEHGLSVGEAFLWGMVAATVGWIALAIFSALVLGAIIRRSDRHAEAEEALLLAKQREGKDPAQDLSAVARHLPENILAPRQIDFVDNENMPSQSGTRFKPVGDTSSEGQVEAGKVRRVVRGR